MISARARGPWAKALAASVALGASVPAAAGHDEHDSAGWQTSEDAVMLLSEPQLDHLNHSNRAWLDQVTERGGIDHVEEQARLECLLDALQPGVAPGEREQLSVEVREGNQAFTGVFGDGHIYFTPEDAAHPAGVRAVAFILAHEMAHTVADHSNKIVSHKLIGELGEDRAKNIVDNRSPYGVEKILLRSESSAEQREFVRGTESEADRGGLHILHRSGVPLDAEPVNDFETPAIAIY